MGSRTRRSLSAVVCSSTPWKRPNILPAGELWGDQRLVETCERLRGLEPEAVVEAVSDALAAFVGEAEPSDDITMMALRYFG